VACLAALPAIAGAACRQALALGLDVSGSVDAAEYRLQVDGLAAALQDRQVQAAVLADPAHPVRIMVFEWSRQDHQARLVDWTEIRDARTLSAVAGELRRTGGARVSDPSTAIGAAMLYGVAALREQGDCWQKTLDISGDGPANRGRHPGDIPAGATAGVTINGLVIGPGGRANTTKNLSNVKTMLGYYRAFVLRGPGSFAETARDYSDFGAAMRRKLLRELRPAAIARIRAATRPQ
uniref:DUF1194 domain-containing protein n=1 Tax=Roseovarius salis TaxID=3376063 RepID=UPI0037CC75A6